MSRDEADDLVYSRGTAGADRVVLVHLAVRTEVAVGTTAGAVVDVACTVEDARSQGSLPGDKAKWAGKVRILHCDFGRTASSTSGKGWYEEDGEYWAIVDPWASRATPTEDHTGWESRYWGRQQ